MTQVKYLLIILITLPSFLSCSDDDDDDSPKNGTYISLIKEPSDVTYRLYYVTKKDGDVFRFVPPKPEIFIESVNVQTEKIKLDINTETNIYLFGTHDYGGRGYRLDTVFVVKPNTHNIFTIRRNTWVKSEVYPID